MEFVPSPRSKSHCAIPWSLLLLAAEFCGKRIKTKPPWIPRPTEGNNLPPLLSSSPQSWFSLCASDSSSKYPKVRKHSGAGASAGRRSPVTSSWHLDGEQMSDPTMVHMGHSCASPNHPRLWGREKSSTGRGNKHPQHLLPLLRLPEVHHSNHRFSQACNPEGKKKIHFLSSAPSVFPSLCQVFGRQPETLRRLEM